MQDRVINKRRLESYMGYVAYWVFNLQGIYNGENGKDLSALFVGKMIDRLAEEGCNMYNKGFIEDFKKLNKNIKGYRTTETFTVGLGKMAKQVTDMYREYSDT